jgi:hypothetical protein
MDASENSGAFFFEIIQDQSIIDPNPQSDDRSIQIVVDYGVDTYPVAGDAIQHSFPCILLRH